MVVNPSTKELILHLKHPDKITKTIPTATTVAHKGKTLVRVPHRTPECKLLQNLGFDPPHPIDYYYDWPGQYTPMEAQRATVRFLSLYNRAYCLNGLGCVDAETEYLTPTGWRKISQYEGEPVAQYWPETGRVEFVDAPEYVKLPCDEMFHLKTKYGLDQVLSPEHRVLLTSNDSPGKQEVVQAWELHQRQEQWVATGKNKRSLKTIGWSRAAIPVTYTPPGGCGLVMTEDELRVQIAVIADGHFPNGTDRCVVRLKKQRKVERLRTLLQTARIPFNEREQNIPTAQGFTVFTFQAPIHDKEFGAAYWEATLEQLAVVRDEVLYWDGCIRRDKPTREFISNSRASADFVQYAFNAGGYTARVVVDARGPTYSVIIRDNGKALTVRSTSGTERNRTMHPVTSPDGFKYCFMVPSTFLVLRRNGCVFASGNTGKSLSALWAYDFLRSEYSAGSLLVIAPLSTLERTWGDELFRHFPHLSFTVLHGTRAQRLQKLDELHDVYIINHDGVKIISKELAQNQAIDSVVIDELSQVARNASTNRWKALRDTIASRERTWGMTGTPTPNAPTDAWAQCRLLTPSTVPPFFSQWRSRTMEEINQYKWVPRENALELVEQAMTPAIRFKREDCMDLPPVMYETRTVPLTPDQERLYKDMEKTLYAQFKGGEITAVNAAVKVMRLVQIASGAAYDPDRKPVLFLPKPRVQALLDIIEEAASKVIVFVPFRASLEMVANELAKHVTVEKIHGGVSKTERDRIFGSFQRGENPQVLVAQPAAMSHGLTLTAASVIIWYAPVTSAETYEQANARITRPGQKHAQLIAHIEGSPAERNIYKSLMQKTSMQNDLLELFISNRG